MMKHLYAILLLFLLCMGFTTAGLKEQPASPTHAGSLAGEAITSIHADCSFTATADALCPPNPYTYNHVSPKLIKIRLQLPAGQLQHSFAHRLPVILSATQSATPTAMRYSDGYYIYALAHILI